MNIQFYYEQFLERVFESADHPAPANTFFLSQSPNLTEDFINNFISDVEEQIAELEEIESNDILENYNRDKLLFGLRYLYNTLNYEYIYELIRYESDFSHDDLPLTDDADKTADLISERNHEIETQLVDNAAPYLNLIKEILLNLAKCRC